MTTKKEHWRNLMGKEFLVGEELDGKDVTLTIKSVSIEELQNAKGKDKKPVMSFEGTDRKVVMNITNMKAVAKTLKTPYYQEWIGKQNTLTPVEGFFFGEQQTVIRIKQDFSNVKIN